MPHHRAQIDGHFVWGWAVAGRGTDTHNGCTKARQKDSIFRVGEGEVGVQTGVGLADKES